ncbi:MAG: hypothetical protein WAO71_15525 [Gallionella sp.]
MPQPKSTPWYGVNWGATILFFGFPIWFCIVYLIDFANGVPERAQLQTVFGKVVKTQRVTPHLLIEFPDGKFKTMELPVNLSMKGGGRVYYGYGWQSEEEAKKLIGCNVEIRGIPMRWTFEERFRVWELICLDKRIVVGGLEASAKVLDSSRKDSLLIFLFVWLLGPVPIFIYVLYRERNQFKINRV